MRVDFTSGTVRATTDFDNRSLSTFRDRIQRSDVSRHAISGQACQPIPPTHYRLGLVSTSPSIDMLRSKLCSPPLPRSVAQLNQQSSHCSNIDLEISMAVNMRSHVVSW